MREVEIGREVRELGAHPTVGVRAGGIAEVFLDDVFKGTGTVVELVVADVGRIEADDVHDRDIDAAFVFAKRVECVRAEQFIVSVVEDATFAECIAVAGCVEERAGDVVVAGRQDEGVFELVFERVDDGGEVRP